MDNHNDLWRIFGLAFVVVGMPYLKILWAAICARFKQLRGR